MRDILLILIVLLIIPLTLQAIADSKTLNQNAAMTITVCTEAPSAIIEAIREWASMFEH